MSVSGEKAPQKKSDQLSPKETEKQDRDPLFDSDEPQSSKDSARMDFKSSQIKRRDTSKLFTKVSTTDKESRRRAKIKADRERERSFKRVTLKIRIFFTKLGEGIHGFFAAVKRWAHRHKAATGFISVLLVVGVITGAAFGIRAAYLKATATPPLDDYSKGYMSSEDAYREAIDIKNSELLGLIDENGFGDYDLYLQKSEEVLKGIESRPGVYFQLSLMISYDYIDHFPTRKTEAINQSFVVVNRAASFAKTQYEYSLLYNAYANCYDAYGDGESAEAYREASDRALNNKEEGGDKNE